MAGAELGAAVGVAPFVGIGRRVDELYKLASTLGTGSGIQLIISRVEESAHFLLKAYNAGEFAVWLETFREAESNASNS